MNHLAQKRCIKLLGKYKVCEGGDKSKIRNTLFNILQEYILSIINKHTRGLGKRERASLSWDCYYNFIEKYDEKQDDDLLEDLRNSVRKTVQRFIYVERKIRKQEVLLPNFQVDAIALEDNTARDEMIMALKELRSALPQEYAEIFDDALMSSSLDKRGHVTNRNKSTMSKRRYYEIKKLLRIFIKHFILEEVADGKQKSSNTEQTTRKSSTEEDS